MLYKNTLGTTALLVIGTVFFTAGCNSIPDPKLAVALRASREVPNLVLGPVTSLGAAKAKWIEGWGASTDYDHDLSSYRIVFLGDETAEISAQIEQGNNLAAGLRTILGPNRFSRVDFLTLLWKGHPGETTVTNAASIAHLLRTLRDLPSRDLDPTKVIVFAQGRGGEALLEALKIDARAPGKPPSVDLAFLAQSDVLWSDVSPTGARYAATLRLPGMTMVTASTADKVVRPGTLGAGWLPGGSPGAHLPFIFIDLSPGNPRGTAILSHDAFVRPDNGAVLQLLVPSLVRTLDARAR